MFFKRLTLKSGTDCVIVAIHRYMRTECLNHRYVYGTPMQTGRLVLDLADKHQRCTQTYVRRPYGVGLLVAAVDQTGPHLYETQPSGDYYEYVAMAIGARSQSAKTYLERHYESFATCSRDDLIKHALKALSGTVSGDKTLDVKSASVGIVGPEGRFEVIDGEPLQRYLDEIEVEGGLPGATEEPMTVGEEKGPF